MGEEGTDKPEFRRVQRQYELGLYKLLIVAAVSILIAVALGAFLGRMWGQANAIDNLDIKTPSYCNVIKQSGEITIKCNELDITAEELCKVTSPGIKEKLKILVIA